MTLPPRRIARTCSGMITVALTGAATADITDFNNWTLAEDPPNANLNASVDSPSQVTLTATGPVLNANDIGYQSVNANTAAESTSGFAFDPTSSFSVAIDYSWTFDSPLGGSAIGFGIGEDGKGDDAVAGVAITAQGNVILGAFAAARTFGDPNATVPIDPGFPPPAIGSMHVSYDAATGNIAAGINAAGAFSAGSQNTLLGSQVYDVWNADGDDDLLLVSFFIRSDTLVDTGLTNGESEVVFSNFRITGGTLPIQIPEPSSLALLSIGGLLIARRRRG